MSLRKFRGSSGYKKACQSTQLEPGPDAIFPVSNRGGPVIDTPLTSQIGFFEEHQPVSGGWSFASFGLCPPITILQNYTTRHSAHRKIYEGSRSEADHWVHNTRCTLSTTPPTCRWRNTIHSVLFKDRRWANAVVVIETHKSNQ